MNFVTDKVRVHTTLLVVPRETTVLTNCNFNVHIVKAHRKLYLAHKNYKKRSKI